MKHRSHRQSAPFKQKLLTGLKYAGTCLIVLSLMNDTLMLTKVRINNFCCTDGGQSLLTGPGALLGSLLFLSVCQLLRIPGYRLALFVTGFTGIAVYIERQYFTSACPLGYEMCIRTGLIFETYIYFCIIMVTLAILDKYIQRMVAKFKIWRLIPIAIILDSIWNLSPSFNANPAYANISLIVALTVWLTGEVISYTKRHRNSQNVL